MDGREKAGKKIVVGKGYCVFLNYLQGFPRKDLSILLEKEKRGTGFHGGGKTSFREKGEAGRGPGL